MVFPVHTEGSVSNELCELDKPLASLGLGISFVKRGTCR